MSDDDDDECERGRNEKCAERTRGADPLATWGSLIGPAIVVDIVAVPQ